MSGIQNCARCSTRLPGGKWGNVCPKCLAHVSLGRVLHRRSSYDAASQTLGNTPTRGLHEPGCAKEQNTLTPSLDPSEGERVTKAGEGQFKDSTRETFLSEKALGSRRFGDYELLEEIARGGMAVVWRARQLSVDRLVALKLLRSAEFARAEDAERFRAEAAAIASLQHPAIVALHDFGEHQGQPWFSMDFVQGRTLAEVVREKPLPPKQAAELLKTIAEAIAYAHGRGILHRDIKPSNILLDQNGQPRITDFGLAKRLNNLEPGTRNPELTLSGQLLGTPNYAPPEQLAVHRGTIGFHSDVYALGGVLYEMLTGRPPFLAATIEATLLQVIDAEPASLRLLNPAVPIDLETICLKCLEKEPARRYATAQALVDELSRFLRKEPIVARPLGMFGQLWRWCRRKPALATSLAALLAALMVGAGLTSWQWQRSKAHATRLAAALLEMRLQRVTPLFNQAESAGAVALLAKVLREEPDNEVVRLRLSAALAQRQFHRAVVPPIRHQQIRIGFFSPDGRHVITTSEKNARLWDACSGELLEEFDHPAPSRPNFSPDGQLLVTFSSSRAVQVWDLASRKKLGPPLVHEQNLRAARFGRGSGEGPSGAPPWEFARELWIADFIDESKVAVATADGMLHLWNARTGQLLRSAARPHAEFSLNRQVFLTPHGTQVKCWDGQTWELIHSFEHDSPVQWARLSPKGDRLATLLSDGKLRVWDVREGRLLSDAITVEGAMWSLVFAPEGERVAAHLRAGYIRLFDVRSGRHLAQFPAAARPIEEQSFAPDGGRLAVIERDGIQLWNTKTGQRSAERLLHEGRIIVSVFGVDPSQLMATAAGGSAHVWNLDPHQRSLASLTHTDIVTSINFNADGTAVLTASKDATARVWDARTGAPITPLLSHEGRIESAQFSPDGRLVATGSTDGTARIWDSLTGAPVTPPLRHGGPIRSVEFDPQGERVLTASAMGTACIWNVKTGGLLTRITHSNTLTMARFDPAGRRMVTTCNDKLARVWQLHGTNANPVVSMRHAIGVQAAAFSSDGQRVATGGFDRTARVWDSLTGQPISPPLRHSLDLTQVRFNRNGKYLLTASQDGAARIWNVQTGVLRGKPMRHGNKVYDAVFSPDERFVLTTSEDDTVRIWDAATGYEVSDPYPQGPTMAGARFSPDGRTIAVAAPGNAAQLWDVSFLTDPVPSRWLADFAEAVVGRRLLSDESLEPVPWERLDELKLQFEQQYPALKLPAWATRYFGSPPAK